MDIEFSSVPYYFDGKVFAQIAIRDVSHRKLSEELSSNNERLASIGQLAAGIVHEIKNPLTAVKGFLQLLKGQVYNTINEHHGVISVESVSGKGTTFNIQLPVHLNEEFIRNPY